jgi:hypothetical protein
MAFGVAAAERMAWIADVAGEIGRTLAWAVVLAALCACVAWWLRRRWSLASLLICGLLAGGIIGGAFWLHLSSVASALSGSHQGSWSGCVVSDPTPGAFGSSSLVAVRLPDGTTAEVRAQWPKGAAPELGRSFDGFGSIVASQAAAIREADFTEGVAGTLRMRRLEDVSWAGDVRGWLGKMRAWESERIDAVAGRGGALLGSTLLGQRWRVAGSSLDQDMRIAGLAHFEATSGIT